jgi:hypothetical protein
MVRRTSPTLGVALALAVVLGGCGGGGSTHPPSPADARACLTKHDFRVTNGGRAGGDANTPETELIVIGAQASAFLAFYADTASADRYVAQISRRAKRVHVTLERHGPLTILWIRGRGTDAARQLRACSV